MNPLYSAHLTTTIPTEQESTDTVRLITEILSYKVESFFVQSLDTVERNRYRP